MARRGRSSDDLDARMASDAVPLNAPFREFRKRWRGRPAPPPKPSPAAKAPPPAAHEVDLFASAVAAVGPLPRGPDRIGGPAPADGHRRPVSEEAEALAELSDLVTGGARFDITDPREYGEGGVIGLAPRLIRRLRRGDFAWQAHVDLHGLTAAAARDVVDRFVLESFRAGRRCILIVHGRGVKNRAQQPGLKGRLT